MLRSRMCASIAAHAAPPSSSCDSSVSEFGQCAENEHFSVSNDICSLKTHLATKTLISVSWVYRVSVRIVLTDSADFNPVTRR